MARDDAAQSFKRQPEPPQGWYIGACDLHQLFPAKRAWLLTATAAQSLTDDERHRPIPSESCRSSWHGQTETSTRMSVSA